MARIGGGSPQRMSTDLAAKCLFGRLVEIVVRFSRIAQTDAFGKTVAMPTPSPWSEAADALTQALSLMTAPIAITFSQSVPDGVAPFDAPMPEPTPDGRTGRVPAGCVFWAKALDRTFSTVAGHSDVAALVESGWVTMDMVPEIPAIADRPEVVTYGPLAATPVDPDVVMIRVNAKQLMVLSD